MEDQYTEQRNKESRRCSKCGNQYSKTYRRCPFCQEEAAARRGRPIYRRGKRLDKKQRSSGAGGILKLTILSIAIIAVGVAVFGDNIAEFLGIRTQQGDSQGSKPPISSQQPSLPSTPTNPDNSGSSSGSETPPTDTVPTALALDQSAITIPSGQTARITATGGNGNIQWSSSNSQIASVNGGSVTGIAGGTVTITAKSGEETATCTVTITGTPWVSNVKLSLNKTDFTIRASDPPVQLKIKGGEYTSAVWSSSNPNVATVSSSGLVTRVGKGQATVTVQVDGHTLTCIVRSA
ncbi:MAG: Ig-like domain-containing protein [Oscillospiraceae bacterium]|nr:Ig-like domain-containing protein [Oscillospiraceae bacterium]